MPENETAFDQMLARARARGPKFDRLLTDLEAKSKPKFDRVIARLKQLWVKAGEPSIEELDAFEVDPELLKSLGPDPELLKALEADQSVPELLKALEADQSVPELLKSPPRKPRRRRRT